MSRNLAASIRARLKQHADATKQDFNLTLTHYGLERLLYRLSVSPHGPNVLLKGALLFSLWYDPPHRPKRDADLLGFGPDDMGSVVAAFKEICQTAVKDGIAFDPASVKRRSRRHGGSVLSFSGNNSRNLLSTLNIKYLRRDLQNRRPAQCGCGDMWRQPYGRVGPQWI